MLSGFLLNLLIASGTMMLFWLIYLRLRNPAVVDVGWAAGLTFMGLTQLLTRQPWRADLLLLAGLVILWGVRLGGYLFWTRIRQGRRDPRYDNMNLQWRGSAALGHLLHYLFQGLFQTGVGMVFLFPGAGPENPLLLGIGAALWLTGFTGVSLADAQLHRFRKNPAHAGQVCRTGLWNYSRHPNYFFECLTWLGFAIPGLGAPLGWIGLASPSGLMLIMLFITGPLSERQSLATKPLVYRAYQQTTSMFVPWFRKPEAPATRGAGASDRR